MYFVQWKTLFTFTSILVELECLPRLGVWWWFLREGRGETKRWRKHEEGTSIILVWRQSSQASEILLTAHWHTRGCECSSSRADWDKAYRHLDSPLWAAGWFYLCWQGHTEAASWLSPCRTASASKPFPLLSWSRSWGDLNHKSLHIVYECLSSYHMFIWVCSFDKWSDQFWITLNTELLSFVGPEVIWK